MGDVDPRKQFFIDIKTRCQQHDFPAWDRFYTFNVYQTAAQTFGHAYIAICCIDQDIQNEYLCIHLNVDEYEEKIFPVVQFKSQEIAKKHVVECSRAQKYTIKNISMRQFTKLALDLIESHGKYHKVSNNCQTFCASFISKLQSYSDAISNLLLYGTTAPTVQQTTTGAATTSTGAIIGILCL